MHEPVHRLDMLIRRLFFMFLGVIVEVVVARGFQLSDWIRDHGVPIFLSEFINWVLKNVSNAFAILQASWDLLFGPVRESTYLKRKGKE